MRSRFSTYTYAWIFLILVFLAIPIFLIIKTQLTGESDEKYIGAIAFSFLSALMFYLYSRFCYLVSIDADYITIKGVFKRKKIAATEIQLIDLFSKKDLYFTIGGETITIKIDLEDGDKIILPDIFYGNIGKVKIALLENFKDKIKPYKTGKTNVLSSTGLETEAEKFAGNPFTSFNGIMICGITIFILILLLQKKSFVPAHLFLSVPIIISYLGFGYQLHYFLISNKRLVVKNHLLPWINKVYNVEDIIEANFESQLRRSDALRISTSDFRSKQYISGSLRSKDWNLLKEKIKALGIYFAES
jgi:hypothetical protein